MASSGSRGREGYEEVWLSTRVYLKESPLLSPFPFMSIEFHLISTISLNTSRCLHLSPIEVMATLYDNLSREGFPA